MKIGRIVLAVSVIAFLAAGVAVAQSGGSNSDVVKVSMTAQQFKFDPATVTVPAGSTVVITVTSKDVTHGLAIPAFNINERIQPGKDTVVKFTADKAGTYEFHCSVFCGSGHRDMKGKIVVQ